jgi:hypothetical protein
MSSPPVASPLRIMNTSSSSHPVLAPGSSDDLSTGTPPSKRSRIGTEELPPAAEPRWSYKRVVDALYSEDREKIADTMFYLKENNFPDPRELGDSLEWKRLYGDESDQLKMKVMIEEEEKQKAAAEYAAEHEMEDNMNERKVTWNNNLTFLNEMKVKGTTKIEKGERMKLYNQLMALSTKVFDNHELEFLAINKWPRGIWMVIDGPTFSEEEREVLVEIGRGYGAFSY